MSDRYLGLQPRRRDFLTRALALGAAGGAGALLVLPGEARAGSIGRLEGEVRINGRLANIYTQVFGGDSISTGADSTVAFVIGGDAFFLRANSRLDLTSQGTSGTIISALRLFSGALGAAFYRGRDRRIIAPNVTAGIRGTGVYVEARADATYFCTCYGAVDLTATEGASEGMKESVLVVSGNHHARTISGNTPAGMRIADAPFVNHSNAEMIALEALAGRPDPFTRR